MTNIITGPGVGLPFPQNLYPSDLNGMPYDAPTNRVGLEPGAAIYVPTTSNRFLIDPGSVSVLQFLDPVTGAWRGTTSQRGPFQVNIDGAFGVRIANLTGCPVAAIVANGGSGFAQATVAITSNVGGSTWQGIVGGALSVSTVSVVGKNYTIAPEVFIPAPPSPGVPATAHSTIANGTVATVVLDNVGAGYPSAPIAVIQPSPFDVNLGTITQATVTLVLNAALSGAITAAYPINNGAPLATLSALTLTAAGGAGTGATLTPQIMQTIIGNSVVAGGVGFGNATQGPIIVATGGPAASVSAIGNPIVELAPTYRSRQAWGTGTTNAGGTISAITFEDTGLFINTPTFAVIPGAGGIVGTAASVTLTMGALNDTILLQPL
jgi:hypothetical protein